MAFTIPPKAAPYIRMSNSTLPGVEVYATIDAYRIVWYFHGWRSSDDPDYVGVNPTTVASPFRGPPGPRGPAGLWPSSTVANEAALPASGELNEFVKTEDNQHGWVWSGTAWDDLGVLWPDIPDGLGTSITAATAGDLYLAVTERAAGVAAGGVIRRAGSIVMPWTYTQTSDPTDRAIGAAVNVDWNATLSGGSGLSGPKSSTEWFGPRPVYGLEGRVNYGTNQTGLGLEPIGFGDLLRVGNGPGVARLLTPGWSFMSSRMILGDGAKVTIQANDTNNGGAAFCDTKALVSLNGGEVDGYTNVTDLVSFLSEPLLSGNARVSRRVGFDVAPARTGSDLYLGGPTFRDVLSGQPGLSGVDADTAVIDESIGFRARYGTRAGRNIGLLNESATVEKPATKALSGASDTIPINSTVVKITSTGPLVLTSTPTIPAGLDGQRLTVVNGNAGTTDKITIQGSYNLVGSGVLIGSEIEPASIVTFRYSTARSAWIVESRGGEKSFFHSATSPTYSTMTPSGFSVTKALGDTNSLLSVASLLDTPFVALGAGGGSVADLYLQRGVASGVLGVNTAYAFGGGVGNGQIQAGQVLTINAQTTTGYTVVGTDKSKHITRKNAAASTQTWPTPASLGIITGSRIPITNLGAGTVTHTTGGATVTGHTAQLTDEVVWATALSTTEWHIAR